MKKEKLKLPYCGAELEMIQFETCDIVTASNQEPDDDENQSYGNSAGGWGSDNNGWSPSSQK